MSDALCSNIAFSGWHSAALAVDFRENHSEDVSMQEDSEGDGEDEREGDQAGEMMPGSYRTSRAAFNPRNIRFGYPARGRLAR